MMKKILITGSAGYAGRSLYTHLTNKGYDVVGLAHKNRIEGQNVVPGDVMNKSTLAKAVKGINAVVHCAAKVGGNWPEQEYCVNSEGTKNVLEAAEQAGVKRFVHLSSLAVVGEYLDHNNDGEDIPYATKYKDYYAPSKIGAERYVLGKKNELKVIILRPGWIWGPGEKSTKELFKMIKNRKFAFIGNGENHIYFVYIDNLLQSIELALFYETVNSGEILNITDGAKITMSEFVNTIASEVGVKPIKRHIPIWFAYMTAFLLEHLSPESVITRQNVSIMSKNMHFNISRARSVLGYKPSNDLKKHIRAVIEEDF